MDRRDLRARVLLILSLERGAVLWIPSLLIASYMVLFGIRQAPAELSLFSHARDLRVILGPLHSVAVDSAHSRRFTAALRERLRAQRELSVVDAQVVAARVDALLGERGADAPRARIRATRNLNARYYLAPSLESKASELWGAVEVWEVARERVVQTWNARDRDAGALARALADSLSASLFKPELDLTPALDAR